MSIKMMAAVYDSDLTDVFEVAVMLALANHADDSGRACYPSLARLCRLTRMKERGVRYVLRRLQARGYLTLEGGGGRARTNRYAIHIRPGNGGAAAENPAPDAPFSEAGNPAPDAPFGQNPAPDAPFKALKGAPDAPETSVSKKEGGGGSAHAHTHEPARGATIIALRRSDPEGGEVGRSSERDAAEEPTDRERLLVAMGHDPTGLTATGKIVGNAEDMAEAGRWRSDLDLTVAEQLEMIRSVITAKRDGPPHSFRYFRPAMQRFAAQKREPQLQPISFTNFQGKRANEHSGNAERTMRRIMAAARGTSGDDWPQG